HRAEMLTSEMERSILEARRREKDFFNRSGDNQYKEMVEKHGAAFLKASGELRTLLATRKALEGTQISTSELDEDMKSYLATFVRSAEVFHERGLPDTGAQGRMRKAAHEIERLTGILQDPQAEILFLQIRRSEK